MNAIYMHLTLIKIYLRLNVSYENLFACKLPTLKTSNTWPVTGKLYSISFLQGRFFVDVFQKGF